MPNYFSEYMIFNACYTAGAIVIGIIVGVITIMKFMSKDIT